MKLYIAGPMRGYDQFNFPAFAAAATSLRAAGHAVLSPAERDLAEGFDPAENSLTGFDVEAAMAADFQMILEADGIFLLDGWEKSKGARAERFVAEQIGRNVYEYSPDHMPWLIPARAWNGNPHLPETTHTTETRVVNAETGGAKGKKLARYDLLPEFPLRLLAMHYGKGAEKYADRNWELGVDWSLNFAALNRHLWAWWRGENDDYETDSPHLAAVAWHAFALMEYSSSHPELDDRPSR